MKDEEKRMFDIHEEKLMGLQKRIDEMESKYGHDEQELKLEKLHDLLLNEFEKRSLHSITQELIDEGAFDVAKSYIDFLKAKASTPQPTKVINAGTKTVSPVGKKTMKKNNGADFGPDTKGTKTSGIQEALDEAEKERSKDGKPEA